ncbi:5786_t:CDS:1, partial [Racocetra persica]
MYWSKGHRIAKKILSLIIRLNCDDEFFDMLDEFILSKTCELKLLEENKDGNNIPQPPQQSQPAI